MHSLFVGGLIVYTAGLLMTILLLVLTLRALRLPGASAANVVFAACALCWSAGGLAYAALGVSGAPRTFVRAAEALQFLGAAVFPIPMLAAWRPFARSPKQRRTLHVLDIVGWSAAGIIAALLAYQLSAGNQLAPTEHMTSVNATVLLCLGAAVSLRPSTTPRAVLVPSLVIIASVAGAAVLIPVARRAFFSSDLRWMLPGIGAHVLMLVVLCSFFLFARFRFADLFVRYSVRILLAAGVALVLALVVQQVMMSFMSGAKPNPAFHVFGITVFAALCMLVFAFADAPISKVVNRWLFHPPDYRAYAKQLGEELRRLPSEPQMGAAVERATRECLELENARLVTVDGLPRWPDGLMEGEIVELSPADALRRQLPLPNVEILVPIGASGQMTHVLLIAPGSNRPALLTNDMNYLRTVAAQCGNRMEALRRERENVERQSREALLQQQVTEAELRALRSQVNPHFLFNSLNTIADLIVKDPARAEEMTMRLAEVFRHVLAHSSRSMTTVRDEMDFLRTYLSIEEVRFRDRLRVEFDVSPQTADEQIPSLILQPLVENAVKHGLAPKPGEVHLWISARLVNDDLLLCIEDDGVGFAPVRPGNGTTGLGLSNVAGRLKTLYRDEARVEVAPRAQGGSRVTVVIPRVSRSVP